MKKDFCKFLVVVIAVLGGIYMCCLRSERYKVSDLTLDNVEALASGENDGYMCFDSGDVECRGHKVRTKIEGLSLK